MTDRTTQDNARARPALSHQSEAMVTRLGGIHAAFAESLHHEVLDDELGGKEISVLRVIEGSATVAEILARSPTSEADTLLALAGLVERGVLEPAESPLH